MENLKYHDCPRCHKNNVVGYKIEPDFKDVGKLELCAMADPLFCVGVGAAANLAAIFAGNTLADGRIDFQFQCPSCGYRFIKTFEK